MSKRKTHTEEIADFEAWLAKAKPGEEYVYHRANMSNSIFGRNTALFACLYEYAAEGQVALLQRKLSPFCFDYLAVRLSKRAPSWLNPLPVGKHVAPQRRTFLRG